MNRQRAYILGAGIGMLIGGVMTVGAVCDLTRTQDFLLLLISYPIGIAAFFYMLKSMNEDELEKTQKVAFEPKEGTGK